MRNIQTRTHTHRQVQKESVRTHNRLSKNASTDWKGKEKEDRYARAMCKQVPERAERAWRSERERVCVGEQKT